MRASIQVRVVLALIGCLWLAASPLAAAQTAGYRLDVEVFNRQNELVAGAEVTVTGPRGDVMKRVTPATGLVSFTVPAPGEHLIVVKHPKHPISVGWTEVRAGDDPKTPATFAPILTDREPYWLDVRVVDDNNTPMPNATVSVFITANGAVTGTTGSDGVASFGLGLAGDYRVEAQADFHEKGGGTAVAATNVSRSNYTVKLTSRNTKFTISVRSEDLREPITGATIRVSRSDGTSRNSNTMQTDLTGVAPLIVRTELKQATSENFELQVSHPDFETKTVPVTGTFGPLANQNVDVTLARKAGSRLVIISVTDGNGNALADVNVRMTNTAMRDQRFFTASTNAAGRAAVSVDVTGTFELQLTRTRYASMNDKFVLAADQKSIELEYEMPQSQQDYRRGVRVTVTARGKDGAVIRVPNAQITLSNGQGGVTDANGRFDFLHRVAPGEELRANVTSPSPDYGDGSGSTTVQVNGTMFDPNAKIDLSTANGIDRITVELPAARKALTGDLILSSGRASPGQVLTVTLAVLMSGGGQPTASLQREVEVIGPKGTRVAQLASGPRTLRAEVYDRQTFSVSGADAGTYTVRARVSNGSNLQWTDSAKFDVVGAASFAGDWKDESGNYYVLTQTGNTISGIGMSRYNYDRRNYEGATVIFAGTVNGAIATWTETSKSGELMYTFTKVVHAPYDGLEVSVTKNHSGEGRKYFSMRLEKCPSDRC